MSPTSDGGSGDDLESEQAKTYAEPSGRIEPPLSEATTFALDDRATDEPFVDGAKTISSNISERRLDQNINGLPETNTLSPKTGDNDSRDASISLPGGNLSFDGSLGPAFDELLDSPVELTPNHSSPAIQDVVDFNGTLSQEIPRAKNRSPNSDTNRLDRTDLGCIVLPGEGTMVEASSSFRKRDNNEFASIQPKKHKVSATPDPSGTFLGNVAPDKQAGASLKDIKPAPAGQAGAIFSDHIALGSGAKTKKVRGGYRCGDCHEPKLDKNGKRHYCAVLKRKLQCERCHENKLDEKGEPHICFVLRSKLVAWTQTSTHDCPAGDAFSGYKDTHLAIQGTGGTSLWNATSTQALCAFLLGDLNQKELTGSSSSRILIARIKQESANETPTGRATKGKKEKSMILRGKADVADKPDCKDGQGGNSSTLNEVASKSGAAKDDSDEEQSGSNIVAV